MTMKVYGRRSASWTMFMAYSPSRTAISSIGPAHQPAHNKQPHNTNRPAIHYPAKPWRNE
jgi:hypothetical protein